MRSLVIVLAVSSVAYADKKIVDMTPGFKRELTACEMQQAGLTLMTEKAKRYVATDPPDKADVAEDIERLEKGLEVVIGYCKEVAAMVTLLEDNAQTPYKKVERDLDARDNSVRKARKDGKKTLDEMAPITRKLIPIVNAKITRVEEKKRTAKFPSGRVVEIPPMKGSWKLGGNAVSDIADYQNAGTMVTITSRAFSSGTCDDQRKQFAAKSKDEPVVEIEVAKDIAWGARYVRRDKLPHLLTMMCAAAKAGGFVVLADVTPADQLAIASELEKVMVAMLAAR